MTEIKPQDIEALLETFENSPWREIHLKIDGWSSSCRRRRGDCAIDL